MWWVTAGWNKMNQLLENRGVGEPGAHVTNRYAVVFVNEHIRNLSVQTILCYKHWNKKEAVTDMSGWISSLKLQGIQHRLLVQRLFTHL